MSMKPKLVKISSDDDLDKVKHRELDNGFVPIMVVENSSGTGYLELDLSDLNYKLKSEAVEEIKEKMNSMFYASNNYEGTVETIEDLPRASMSDSNPDSKSIDNKVISVVHIDYVDAVKLGEFIEDLLVQNNYLN